MCSPSGTTPGSCCSIGSSSDNRPSSTSCSTTVATKGLVTLPIRKYPDGTAAPSDGVAPVRCVDREQSRRRSPVRHELVQRGRRKIDAYGNHCGGEGGAQKVH